ncbi:MAG TPA: L,D-transpeptidase family protein [Allosphingosinicella sp.]|jgi:lipoprotein-anchoring transpeptidase ErfK/SrfK
MSAVRSWLLRTSVFAVAMSAFTIQSSAAEHPALASDTVAAPLPAPVNIVSPLLPETAAPAAAPAPIATPVATPAPAAVPAAMDPAALRPGHYVWQPERSPTGRVEIVVSIPQQVAYIYRGGTLIGLTTVSTGRPGHATPTGRYPIMEKHREHYSNLYNNAPMPFMQRLTMGGIALHAGQIPGRPASHGCVRLPLDFARILFGVTERGTTVHILDRAPTPASALAVARGEPVPLTRGSLVVASADGVTIGNGTN